MADEKITYEIIIDDSKAAATGKKVAGTFKEIKDTSKEASSSAKDFSQGLDKLAPGLSSTITGLQGMIKQSIAFIATPLGATLVLIAGGIAAVNASMKTNDAQADKFEERWAGINQVLDASYRRFGMIGEVITKLLSGDFAGAMKTAEDANKGFNEELSKSVPLAQKLTREAQALEDATNQYQIRERALRNDIELLIIQSKDRTKTESERAELSKKAAALEETLANTQRKLTEEGARIELEKLGLKHDMQRRANEDVQEYGRRLLANTEIGGEEAKKIVAAIRSIDEAQSGSIALQAKLANQQELLAEQGAARRQKELDDKKKATDEDQKLLEAQKKERQVNHELYLKQMAERLKAENDLNATILTNMQTEMDDERAASDANYEAEVAKQDKAKETQKVEFLLGQQKLANAATVLNQVAGLIDKNSAAYKVLAISQALVDTYRAATAALAPPPIGAGPLFGPILAGTTIALGLANVAKITGFYEGGYTGKGNPKEVSTKLGDRGYTYHKDEYVTPSRVLNTSEGSLLVGRLEALRTKGRGYSGMGGYFDGGFAAPFDTAAIANQVLNERQMSTLINAVRQTSQRVLVIEDVEALIDQRLSVRQEATI